MLLRKDDPWLNDLPIPDIRDWRVVDENGQTVGFVQSLAIDAHEMVFEAVLTGANDRYPSEEVEVEEHVVRVKRSLQRPPPRDDSRSGRVRRFGEAFRDHFRSTYVEGELSFAAVGPAYAFGRTISLDADYAGRSFRRAEEDIRAEYVSRRLVPDYDAVREAVRFGYELVQRLDRYQREGMEGAAAHSSEGVPE